MDVEALRTFFDQTLSNTVLGFYNTLSGSAFSEATILALSIQPYINASIIIQLLTIAIPALERLAKEGGEEGRKKIAAITTRDDATDVLDELIDRYGDPPRSVQGLVDISLVRVTAARAGIVEIVQRNDNLILYTDVVTPAQMGAMMDAMPHRVIYNAVGRPYISLHVLRGEDPLTILRDAVALLPGA